MLLAEFLKNKREQLNLTQKQLAKIIGISQSYINMIEVGNRKIGKNKIEDFAKALNVSKATIEKYNNMQNYTYDYDKRGMAIKQIEKRKLELDILITKTENTLQYLKNAREILNMEINIDNEKEGENKNVRKCNAKCKNKLQ